MESIEINTPAARLSKLFRITTYSEVEPGCGDMRCSSTILRSAFPFRSALIRPRGESPRRPTFCAAFFIAAALFTTALSSFAANFYVDFASGNDSNIGTSTSTPWKHCPGDPAASSIAAAKTLLAGDTVFFKGGVSYVLSGPSLTGISLKWSGNNGNPITYDGNSAGNWGTGKAIITDNYSGTVHHGFDSQAGCSDVTIKNFLFKGLGGERTLPADPGHDIPARQGVGIEIDGPTRVTIQDCDFTEIGYWFNKKPMGTSLDGFGIWMVNWQDVVVTGCNFSRVVIAIELATSRSTNNVTITDCTFTDSIMWCIDIGMRSAGASIAGLTIKNCTFYDYHQFDQDFWQGYGEWPHTDGIFFRTDYDDCQYGDDIYFYNNLFYSSVGTAGGTASIYITEGPNANVYNNLFVHQGKTRAISFANGPLSPGASDQLVRVVNNTFIGNYTNQIDWGHGTSRPVGSGKSSIFVRNNIFVDTQSDSGNNWCVYSATGDPATNMTWDYNLYQTGNRTGNFFYWKVLGECRLPELRAHGWELHGLNTDPKFVNVDRTETQPLTNNLRLQATSPAIGAGTNLSSLNLPGLSRDRDGKARPSSGAWDIGAYAFAGTPSTPLPDPASNPPPGPAAFDPAAFDPAAFGPVSNTKRACGSVSIR